jgi:outer membrane lipoprotein SlyB
MKAWMMFFLMAISLAGCTGKAHRPIVDFAASPGKSPATYEQDLSDCQEYAESISAGRSTATGAAGGAALGAVISGVVGAIFGSDFGTSAAAGAAAGGIGGGAGGAASAARTQQEIINNCMRGRGYSVLH